MPTRPPIDGVIKHQIMIFARSMWRVNTIRVSHDGDPITQAMVDADRAAIKAWATANWRQRSNVQAAIVRLKAWDLSTAVPTKFADDPMYLAPIVGLNASSNMASQQLCFCASYRTGLVGDFPKPPSGRLYHAGVHQAADLPTGDFTVDEFNALIACYDALRTAFTGVGNLGTLCIVSYWLGGSRAAPVLRDPPVALPVTRTYGQRQPRTQRRHAERQASYASN